MIDNRGKMFTGIIQEIGIVEKIRRHHGCAQMHVSAQHTVNDLKVGSSIAVNGACLTAVGITNKGFSVDVSSETLRLTNLGFLKEGEGVNLERSLRLGDGMDGHLVTGHVEGLGVLGERKEEEGGHLLFIETPKALLRYCIKKGSAALDGISLTINEIHSDGFYVMIIPHTLKMTTLGQKDIGSKLNLETDLIGKFVERFIKPYEQI